MMVVIDDDGDIKMVMVILELIEMQFWGKKCVCDDGQNGNFIIGKVRYLKKNDGELFWCEDI